MRAPRRPAGFPFSPKVSAQSARLRFSSSAAHSADFTHVVSRLPHHLPPGQEHKARRGEAHANAPPSAR
ncbi:hypothetical protein HIM_00624 [Hirsutella minnesotensis 3608]|nr:hypothetical protein HIM_00624 [Hirsutella minnesotensis 3608]